MRQLIAVLARFQAGHRAPMSALRTAAVSRRRRYALPWLHLLLAALLLLALIPQNLMPMSPVHAASGCDIVCENAKPGAPASQWDVSGAGDPSIQGFATDISVNIGNTIYFKIKTASTKYNLTIYRMGY